MRRLRLCLLAESATAARTDARSPWPAAEASRSTRDGAPTAAMLAPAAAEAAGTIEQRVTFLDPPVFAELSMPDLAGPDPAGADLAGADLAGADLAGADLAGADLAGADPAALEPVGFNPADEAAPRANSAAGIGAEAAADRRGGRGGQDRRRGRDGWRRRRSSRDRRSLHSWRDWRSRRRIRAAMDQSGRELQPGLLAAAQAARRRNGRRIGGGQDLRPEHGRSWP